MSMCCLAQRDNKRRSEYAMTGMMILAANDDDDDTAESEQAQTRMPMPTEKSGCQREAAPSPSPFHYQLWQQHKLRVWLSQLLPCAGAMAPSCSSRSSSRSRSTPPTLQIAPLSRRAVTARNTHRQVAHGLTHRYSARVHRYTDTWCTRTVVSFPLGRLGVAMALTRPFANGSR